MEIYKDLSNPASQEFEKLLNSQLSKNSIEESAINIKQKEADGKEINPQNKNKREVHQPRDNA